MSKVKRSTPVTAPAPLAPGATAAAKAKKSAPAGAAVTAAGKSPAAAAPLVVIEISSSPDRTTGGSRSAKKARKRPAPRLLDLDDEVEMWTPRQKQRLDEDCQILARDPLSSTTEVVPSPAAAANDEIAVVAERGKVRLRLRPDSRGWARMKCLTVKSEMCDLSDVVFKGRAFNLKCAIFLMWYCRLLAEITHIRGLLVQSTHFVQPLMNTIVTR